MEAMSIFVTPDVHFQKDLGLDSLDNVKLVMALEEEFKLVIPDLEADKFVLNQTSQRIHLQPSNGRIVCTEQFILAE
ncbi:hypothetical protein Ancab_037265 [Ancistrocladus abbreviatus]